MIIPLVILLLPLNMIWTACRENDDTDMSLWKKKQNNRREIIVKCIISYQEFNIGYIFLESMT